MTSTGPTPGPTIERTMNFSAPKRGRKPKTRTSGCGDTSGDGRVPRVARMVALGLRIEELVARGDVASYAAVAELGGVTRARVAQFVALINLAPDIIEEVLFMPRVTSGGDPISEHNLRPIAAENDWNKQRRMWKTLLTQSTKAATVRFFAETRISKSHTGQAP